ncbi:hypothetical protein AAHC03_09179 [Spirometra sp. Aus1]
MWFKNGRQFAENCLNFRILPLNFTCIQNGTFVELLFNAVEYEIRGNWSCQHGDQSDGIEVNVKVPLIVKTSEIKLMSSTSSTTVSGASALRRAGEIHDDAFSIAGPRAAVVIRQLSVGEETTTKLVDVEFGSGTRANPINLIQSQLSGMHSVEIECSTNCVSQLTPLRWTIRNGTIMSEYETQLVSNGDCPDGLSTIRTRATFTCLIRPIHGAAPRASAVPSSGHNPPPPPLVGLNRITCAPGRLGRTIEHSLLHLSFGCSTSAAPVAGSLDEDCLQNGYHNSVCLFIVCPGPPAPYLTYGEKVALSVGVIQAAVLLLCLLAVRGRGANQHVRPGRRLPGHSAIRV